MLVAHLSDLHVTEGPALQDQAMDLAAIAGRLLELRPDLVLLTGDLYGHAVPHRPSPAERAVLEPVLVRLAEAAPVLVLQGNHDHGPALELLEGLGGVYPIQVLTKAGVQVVQTPAGPARVYHMAYPTTSWLLASSQAKGRAEAVAEASRKLHGLLAAWGDRMRRQRQAEPTTPILFLGHFQVRGSALSSGEVLASNEIEIERSTLSTLPVDYGALGHVHARQEVAPRWWYAGSPWPVDFGEREVKRYHWIELLPGGPDAHRFTMRVAQSPARPWLTLRYRWAADREDGAPRWVGWPSAEELEQARGAVVRARLTVPDTYAASCPWDAELEALRALAHRVKRERVVEPTVRVRAPQVAEAATLEDKIAGWWETLEAPPEDQDRAATLEALAELRESDDDQIRARTSELLEAARG